MEGNIKRANYRNLILLSASTSALSFSSHSHSHSLTFPFHFSFPSPTPLLHQCYIFSRHGDRRWAWSYESRSADPPQELSQQRRACLLACHSAGLRVFPLLALASCLSRWCPFVYQSTGFNFVTLLASFLVTPLAVCLLSPDVLFIYRPAALLPCHSNCLEVFFPLAAKSLCRVYIYIWPTRNGIHCLSRILTARPTAGLLKYSYTWHV